MKVAYCCTPFQFKYITSFLCLEVNTKTDTFIFYERGNTVDVYTLNSNNSFDKKHSFFIDIKNISSCWSFSTFMRNMSWI